MKTINPAPHALWPLATLILVCLSGCGDYHAPETRVIDNTSGSAVHVIRIDGCQYLERYWDRSFTLTHKGNCDNPIHRHQ